MLEFVTSVNKVGAGVETGRSVLCAIHSTEIQKLCFTSKLFKGISKVTTMKILTGDTKVNEEGTKAHHSVI